MAVKVPLDAYMMDFVFSEREDGGIFDNKYGMDYHIPVFGGIVKEPPMNIVHISVEMAPIAKVNLGIDLMVFLSFIFFSFPFSSLFGFAASYLRFWDMCIISTLLIDAFWQ